MCYVSVIQPPHSQNNANQTSHATCSEVSMLLKSKSFSSAYKTCFKILIFNHKKKLVPLQIRFLKFYVVNHFSPKYCLLHISLSNVYWNNPKIENTKFFTIYLCQRLAEII